jgi:hypothetical protein
VATRLRSRRYPVSSLEEAIELFYTKGWTDGLPVVPPTEERVLEFLEYGMKEPEDIIGYVPERGRAITAEKVAINAVMAGCLPNYMPVIIAALEAMADERFNLHGVAATTMGAAPMLIVSGPVAQQLRIHSGNNVLGPGWRANATIGRAVRLVLMNVCGAIPGVLDKSTFGQPAKYTCCIAEDEEHSPWTPLRVELGYPEEVSTVTVFAATSFQQVSDVTSYTPEDVVGSLATALGPRPGRQAVLLIGGEHRGHIVRGGWGKEEVRRFIQERTGGAFRRPEDLLIVAAGGDEGHFSVIVRPWADSEHVTRPIGVCIDC